MIMLSVFLRRMLQQVQLEDNNALGKYTQKLVQEVFKITQNLRDKYPCASDLFVYLLSLFNFGRHTYTHTHPLSLQRLIFQFPSLVTDL